MAKDPSDKVRDPVDALDQDVSGEAEGDGRSEQVEDQVEPTVDGGAEDLDDADLDDAEDLPGGVPVASTQPETGWQRLSRSFFRPADAPGTGRTAKPVEDLSHLTDAERRERINRIDSTERKVGIAAAVLAGIFVLVYSVPFMVSKIKVATTVKPVHKTCAQHLTYTTNSGSAATCNGVLPISHYVWELVIGLVLVAAIVLTVRIGRRAPLAFAIVLTGLYLSSFILLIPFLVAGGWLLLRAWRTQRYGAPTAKAPVEGYVRPAPGAGRSARGAPGRAPANGTGRNSTRRQRRDGPAEDLAPRPAPAASKRYTPKAPPRKKAPPPSR